MLPEISVVIPTFNRKELLRELILSLFQQSYPKERYEIIVIDNSSTDGTVQLIQEFQQRSPCRLSYYKKENKGPAASRNLGIKNASGSIIAFTDSDCTVHSDWLKNAVPYFEENEVAFVSGQKLPKPNQPISFFSPFQEITEENPVYPTLNIFYRRDILNAVGGFDEKFSTTKERPEGGEDSELAWRIKRQGWKNVFAKDVIIYHEVFRYSLFEFLVTEPWRWRQKPFIFKVVPELREKFLFLKIFTSSKRPFIYMALLGILFTIFFSNKLFLILTVPYIYTTLRNFGIYNWRNPVHIVKWFIQLNLLMIRDIIISFINIYGSIRYRTFVL